jgi:predicted O-methyltransferase YrrM
VSGLLASETHTSKRLTDENEDGISGSVCELLYGLARDVSGGQAIVEVGRGKGKSTVWLVRGSEAGNKNKVFSFALQDYTSAPVNTDSVIGSAETGIHDILVLQHPASEDTVRKWKEKIGLLWVNASGEAENLKSVLQSWERHLSPDARVVVSNCDKPGHRRVIEECLGNLADFTYERSVDNAMVLMVDQCKHYWIINSDEVGVCKYCSRKRNFKRIMREATEAQNKKKQICRKKSEHKEAFRKW